MSLFHRFTGFLFPGLVVASFCWPAAAAERISIMVYTAMSSDFLGQFKDAFEADNPDIEIKWVRDANGVITARLLAERESPRADVLWGVSVFSLERFIELGMLEPYAPAGLQHIKPAFLAQQSPPYWVGNYIWSSVICFNTAEGDKRRLPQPRNWRDLTNPAYVGQILMPHPASSGTGFMMVAGWLQLFGEEAGWRFMDELDRNIAWYLHSGTRTCRDAAAGETVIGLSFEFRAAQFIEAGAPMAAIYPEDGLGWDMDATAVMRSTKKMNAARRVADWAASASANRIYAKEYAIIAHQAVKPTAPGIPTDIEAKLIAIDQSWVAANRDRILKEWARRYEGKAERRKGG